MFNRKTFSDNLRQLRTSHNLKQSELGGAVGISAQQISNMEAGERAPSVEVLTAIADYFSVSVGYLLGEEISEEDIPMWEPAKILKYITRTCELVKIPVEKALVESGVGVGLLDELKVGIRPTIERIVPLAEYLGAPIGGLIGVEKDGTPVKPATQEEIANTIIQKFTEKGFIHDGMNPEEINILYDRIDAILDLFAKFTDNK